jgi:hypothetical protein
MASRRSAYNEDIAKDIVKFVEQYGLSDFGGATIAELCKHVCISESAFYDWRLHKEGLAEKIEKAKRKYRNSLEKRMVRALVTAAEGYEWVERKVRKDGAGNVLSIEEKTRHEAVNVGAAIFLLTNVAPERWQNVTNQNIKAAINVEQITGMRIE